MNTTENALLTVKSVRPHPPLPAHRGQSLVESGIVIMLMSLIFFGLFQVSQLHMANEVMINAAAAGARSKAVGFNDFMAHKVVNVATIPNAGRMEQPTPTAIDLPQYTQNRTLISYWNQALNSGNRGSQQAALEISSIPLYLGTDIWAGLPGVLDYEDWDTVRWPIDVPDGEGVVRVSVSQDFPLKFPMHRAFIRDDEADIRKAASHGDFGEIFLQ